MNKFKSSINEHSKLTLTPAIEKSGWDRELQISFCEDEDFVYSNLNTEYVLFYKPNIPVAVISVTESNTEMNSGIVQAIENAKALDVPCAFSSNGNGFLFYNQTMPVSYAKTELNLDNFPTPEQLWAIYLNYKNAETAVNETINAAKKGQNRLLLGIAAVGAGIIVTAFQLIKGLFNTNTNKRALYLTDKDDYWQNRDWNYWRDEHKWQNRNDPQNRDNRQNYFTPLSQLSSDNSTSIYIASAQDLSDKSQPQYYKQFPSDFFDVIIVNKNSSGNISNTKEWQELLEYFKTATQIAVTPHTKTTESDVNYFGKPIYVDISKQILDSSFPTYYLSSKENPISHITNNSHIENNINISTNNNTIINNSTTNNYTDNGNTVINKTENFHTQITHNKITINSTIMARQTSYEFQIELAEELKKYLHGFQERLGNVAQNYQKKSHDLYEAGMMDEFHQKFEQDYVQETIRKIANVVEQINERDIPFIVKYINHLEQNPSK